MFSESFVRNLNQDERKKIEGTMTEKGKVERKGWKLSFDKKSYSRNEAVLNFVQTNNSNDVYYTSVYEVDADTHNEIMRREMGQGNVEKWKHDEPAKFNSYSPHQLQSNLGTTEVFIIPETEQLPTPTNWEAEYVVIVRRGIEESFKDMPKEKEVNLQVLKKAVEESSRNKGYL